MFLFNLKYSAAPVSAIRLTLPARLKPIPVDIALLVGQRLRVLQPDSPLLGKNVLVVRGEAVLVAELGESDHVVNEKVGATGAAIEEVVADSVDADVRVVMVETTPLDACPALVHVWMLAGEA